MEALQGEFESSSSIHAIVGNFTPKPLSWGSFKSLPNVYYYICTFRELADELPEPNAFCAKLASLHNESVSPDGKFGFHVVTYNGDLPQENGRTITWEDFFINGFKHMIKLNIDRGGPWQEMDNIKKDMFEKIIPRLLRPMETGGHSIKPSLLHGDLWCGNAAVDTQTGRPQIYDSASFYGHNECEFHYYLQYTGPYLRDIDDLGNWRPERNKFCSIYFDTYHFHIPKSFPEEDYEDRNALYAMLVLYSLTPTKTNKQQKVQHAGSCYVSSSDEFERIVRRHDSLTLDALLILSSVIDEMKRLIAKFPQGYRGYQSPVHRATSTSDL